VVIEVTPGDAPVVSVTGPMTKKNIDTRISLSGQATSGVPGTLAFRWTASGGSVDLDDPAVVPAGRNGASLVIEPGSLSRGTDYRFRLTATDANGHSGYSEVLVRTNEAPTSGSFLITPSEGTALTTMFSLSASGWSDPDLPLRY